MAISSRGPVELRIGGPVVGQSHDKFSLRCCQIFGLFRLWIEPKVASLYRPPRVIPIRWWIAELRGNGHVSFICRWARLGFARRTGHLHHSLGSDRIALSGRCDRAGDRPRDRIHSRGSFRSWRRQIHGARRALTVRPSYQRLLILYAASMGASDAPPVLRERQHASAWGTGRGARWDEGGGPPATPGEPCAPQARFMAHPLRPALPAEQTGGTR
jgi:hypothetical protein